MNSNKRLIQKAAILAGGYPALAKKLGITRQAIYQWTRVPADRVVQVARLSGLSRHELRPELYPEL